MPVPPRDIHVIGVPLDLGQSLRGVDIGPGAVRYAGLGPALRAAGTHRHRLGRHRDPQTRSIELRSRSRLRQGHRRSQPPNCALAEASVASGATPIFVGGDHAMSIGSVSGVTAAGRTGILWIDAHGDLNSPESSPSGNIHGMPLATLLGTGLPELVQLGGRNPKVLPEDVVLLAIRELDPGERAMALELGLKVLTMRDIDERGIAKVVRGSSIAWDTPSGCTCRWTWTALTPRLSQALAPPSRRRLATDLRNPPKRSLVVEDPLIGDHNRPSPLAESLFGKAILKDLVEFFRQTAFVVQSIDMHHVTVFFGDHNRTTAEVAVRLRLKASFFGKF